MFNDTASQRWQVREKQEGSEGREPTIKLGPKWKWKSFSRIWLFATPWTVACQAPLSMGFSRQEYLSGLPCPPPGDLPNPGIKPRFPALQADSLPTEPQRNSSPKSKLSAVLLAQSCPTLCNPIDWTLGEEDGNPLQCSCLENSRDGGAAVYGVAQSRTWLKWLSSSSSSGRLDPARLVCPWDSPGNNTGMGCHFLPRGSFQPRGWNLGLLHCRQILYCLNHQGSLGVWWTQVIMVSDSLLLQVSNLMPEMLQGPDPWGSAGGAWARPVLCSALCSLLFLIHKIHKHQNKVNHELIHLLSIQSSTPLFRIFTNLKYYTIVNNN